MCTFEVLSPRIDIVNYLVPTWHVSSTSCNLLVFRVKMMSDILAIYHRELFPNTSCLLTIGNHISTPIKMAVGDDGVSASVPY